MFNRLTFKTRILSVMFLLSAIALFFFGVSAYDSVVSLNDGKKTQLKAASDSILDKIDRNLFERYGDVQAFAMSEPARSINPERINNFMKDMMGAYAPIYDLMIVTNAKGQVIAVNGIDKKGQPISSQSLLGKDYSNEEWFKMAVEKKINAGEAFVQDLHIDSDVESILKNGGRVMNFTAPIIDKKTGSFLGVWTNRMSWQDVVATIVREESAKIKSDRITDVFAYLLDSQNKYMIHPSGEELEFKMASADLTNEIAQMKGKSSVISRDVAEKYFSGAVFESLSPSKGYSTYPSRNWTLTLQAPATDASISANMRLIVIALIVMGLVNFFGWRVINSLGTLFEKAIAKIDHESRLVKDSANSITDASRSLAEATTQQASALQETAASIEETNAMIKKSSENTSRSQAIAGQSQNAAGRGKEAVSEVILAIEEINQGNQIIMGQINESNAQIEDIVKLIGEIESKTKVINDIVFQTKLLSFNASVEAARAGEHGKGFAVVAEEVGNLAQMSGNAAKEISEMLSGSIQKVQGIVSQTKSRVNSLVADTKEKVERGTEVARRAGSVIDEIVHHVDDVNSMMGEIANASQEQTIGVGEITKAMNELDQVTQVNASTSEQVSGAAVELSNQADSLFDVVGELSGAVYGSGKRPAESAPGVVHEFRKPTKKSLFAKKTKIDEAA